MAEANVIATIPRKNFFLKIANISKLETIWSPEEMVHGIPWKIKVTKTTSEEEQRLGVYLCCAITDKSPDWSHVAAATFKLQPLSGNKSGITRGIEPYVFDSSGIGYGNASFIKWSELLNAENNYVKDDTLTLDITIEAANPKNPSKLLFATIEKSCVESCSSKYRLNVTNIDNLMAVKSSQFKVRNLPWLFMVYKDLSHLRVSLHCRSPSTEISCKLEVLLKLISSKKDVKPIEPAPQTAVLKNYGVLTVGKIISWDELVKPENGFVNDNSIVMEVEVRASKSEVPLLTTNRNN
ncbi:uncharacterized protein LOC129565945 isoform X2 [Sitodiplosis mosellana]|uniref:uncharacterized protein LOC129565945 isoform X2 n=1 Tax=Sitodiplosis mosellana TaxID=263140 RepID=UPI0024450F25|nr:uncharacterized protein LOC129565945 isoform X2 [Sitodiplosis mosellana]XP_055297307.1 uncharacterized protein LOC129565945 isoform X2 [Sitodiplosis mosellana]